MSLSPLTARTSLQREHWELYDAVWRRSGVSAWAVVAGRTSRPPISRGMPPEESALPVLPVLPGWAALVAPRRRHGAVLARVEPPGKFHVSTDAVPGAGPVRSGGDGGAAPSDARGQHEANSARPVFPRMCVHSCCGAPQWSIRRCPSLITSRLARL